MFDGFVPLESTARGIVLVRTPSQAPVDADVLPTYRVYAGSGLMAQLSGSLELLDTGTVTGASNNNPITVTSAGHNRVTGDRVTVTGVVGNTNANGDWSVTVVDGNTFILDGSVGNAAYTSGGVWHSSGVYRYSIDATTANGFVAGQTYWVEVTASVGGFPFSETHTLIVV